MEVEHVVFERLKFDAEEILMFTDNQTKRSPYIPEGLTMKYQKSKSFRINVDS